MSNQRKASIYKQVDLKTRIEDASPHRLVQMLFEGALGAIAEARGATLREDIAAKGQMVTKAVNIISALRDSLNMDVGNELPYDLERLYDYMQRRLLEAHARNKVEWLEEVAELLQTLKSGWDEIGS